MNRFTVQIESKTEKTEVVAFTSFHSASRFFKSWVCDAGISGVFLLSREEDGKFIELGRWINMGA